MNRAVLFDLDGTLVDTAHDLGYALNLQRERHGLPFLPHEVIRPYASHGSKGLLGVGFGLTPKDSQFAEMREEYLNFYDAVFTRSPIFFDGIVELLRNLEEHEILWGVVTNKPRRFTAPMMKAIGLETRAAAIVCGDDALPKPAPDTLFLACQQSGVTPATCWYIGDAERDIQAGKAAGMKTAAAVYGYLDVKDNPEQWKADALINHPLEVINLLQS